MKNKFLNKRTLLIVMLVGIVGFIMAVPIFDNKTVFRHITASISQKENNKLSAVDEPEQKPTVISEEIWKELFQIADANGGDVMTMSGKLLLYDNLDDKGVKETENFIMYQSGRNFWLKLDSFERVQLTKQLIMIDHMEKEVVQQEIPLPSEYGKIFQFLDKENLKETLLKDGTEIDMAVDGNLKVLHIRPGMKDAVNEYHIYYDPSTYNISKLRIDYTSFPYESYEAGGDSGDLLSENTDEVVPEVKQEAEANEEVSDDEDAIEVNLTEYSIEFQFNKIDNTCPVNFIENNYFSFDEKSKELILKKSLSGYKKVQ
jgi:hypothetical protein